MQKSWCSNKLQKLLELGVGLVVCAVASSSDCLWGFSGLSLIMSAALHVVCLAVAFTVQRVLKTASACSIMCIRIYQIAHASCGEGLSQS